MYVLGAQVRGGAPCAEPGLAAHLVVSQVLEGLGPDGLGDLQGAVDVVVTVQEHLWLHNGHQTGVLGNGSVAGQAVGAVTDGDDGWASWDGHHGAPLGEAGAGLVVVSAALVKAVQTHAPLLAVAVGEGNEALVDLDAWDNLLVLEHGDHGLAGAGVLVQGLLEQDGTRDVLAQAWGAEEQLTVSTAVVLGVLHADGVQALAAGGIGLIHGQDTTAWGGNGLLRSRKWSATAESALRAPQCSSALDLILASTRDSCPIPLPWR